MSQLILEEVKKQLQDIANRLVEKGKLILATDESRGTMATRFKDLNLQDDIDLFDDYREILFSTPGLGEYISGIILFDQTLRDAKTEDGKPLVDIIREQGIIPGIKVDPGLAPFNYNPVEQVSKGLDGLSERIIDYRDNFGTKFTKFRVVFTIGDGTPSDECIEANTDILTEYVITSQQGIQVPMAEPEVLMKGSHSAKDCYKATNKILGVLFKKLEDRGVYFPGMLLKTNMVVPGEGYDSKWNFEEIADLTIDAIANNVPQVVPGYPFLSGGQKPRYPTMILSLIKRRSDARKADILSGQGVGLFGNPSGSFGREFQDDPRKIYANLLLNGIGTREDVQTSLRKNVEAGSLATRGNYISK